MLKEIIATGKTVEEAYQNVKEKLGVDSLDGMECSILDIGKKGIFGLGGSLAKVKVIFIDEPEDSALDFIKTLLKNMNIDADAQISDTDEGGKIINISGDAAGVLIGHHGDTLDALQYLAGLAANKARQEGDNKRRVRLTVDIENYRAKREKTLRALARRMAEKTLRYRRSVMLEPMNPYERRIIHSEIQNIDGVSTNSIGADNNRKIVIYLSDKSPSEKSAAAKKSYSKAAQNRGQRTKSEPDLNSDDFDNN